MKKARCKRLRYVKKKDANGHWINAKCAVDGCESLAKIREYCSPHYQRKRKYNDPLGKSAGRKRTKAAPQTEKKCAGCGETKPASSFWMQKTTNRLYPRCKPCTAAYNAEQNSKHSEKRSVYRQEYFQSRGMVSGWDRGREQWKVSDSNRHDWYLKRTYGISLNEYEAILIAQGGVCAICRQPCNRQSTKRFCVDHDHETGHVRGLLCFQCNVGLGKFDDNPATLSAAINYLETRKSDIKGQLLPIGAYDLDSGPQPPSIQCGGRKTQA